jgi:hypothetical protein
MRSLGGLIGLLVAVLIGSLIYKYYFTQSSTGAAVTTPTQTIDVVGVKGDLLTIAQSERAYQAEHGSYASLDELVSSGAMSMAKPGRDGYTYGVETSADSFRVVAHCPSTSSPGCTNYAIDQTMEVQTAP